MLLAELGSTDDKNRFTCINYDGNVRTDTTATVIGGTEAIETGMAKLSRDGFYRCRQRFSRCPPVRFRSVGSR